MTLLSRLNNKKGISLIELAIAMGIVAILLSTVFTVLFSMQKTYSISSLKLNNTIDKTLGERFIWLSAVNSAPSFNNLTTVDDNNNLFWDYYDDYPAKLLAAPSRTKTLDVVGETIEMLLFTKQTEPAVYYDPIMAFDVALGGTANVTGTMTFQGLNNADYLNTLNPAIFVEGQMILIYTPVGLRPVGTAQSTQPPLPTIFSGVVSGTSVTADDGGGVIRNTQPVTGAAIASAEDFFLNAPAVGGAIQMVFVAGVELIRFELRAGATSTSNTLVRSTWIGGGWNREFTVATNINSAVFARPSVSNRTVDGVINFNF